MPVGPFRNTILQHLDAATIERLQLRPAKLPLLHPLEVPGTVVKNVFFVEHGVASMTTMFRNGSQVETSMFGYESVIGIAALIGARRSLNGVFMQLEGDGYVASIEKAHQEFARGEAFQKLALRYVQAQLTLSTQSAACNSTHTCEQRLARWLLICFDCVGQDEIEMGQDSVSQLLGSTRSTVSIAAAHLRAKGYIDYFRGKIQLLDPKGLEGEACECYRVVRNHLDDESSFDALSSAS